MPDPPEARLPNASYAVNGAYVADTTATIVDVGTVITYIAKNDGTTPPYVATFGFGQEQIDIEPSSIIGNLVTIRPGPGSTRATTTFRFTSVSQEDVEPAIYQPVTSDGPINEDGYLVPNDVEDITIQFVGRDAEGPPTWFIRVGSSWFSSYTTIETTRVTVTIQLTEKINSVVVAARALGSGARVYKYSEKVGKVLKR